MHSSDRATPRVAVPPGSGWGGAPIPIPRCPMLVAEIVAFDVWPVAGLLGGSAVAFGLVLAGGIVGGAWVVSGRLDKLADAVRQLNVGLHVLGARMESVERRSLGK